MVVASRLSRVEVLPDEDAQKQIEALGYDGGFSAGYQAGLLEGKFAYQEKIRESEKKIQEVSATLAKKMGELNQLNRQALNTAQEHLPDLLLTVLSKILEKHTFARAEIAAEIDKVLKELTLAESIFIECAEAEMAQLEELVKGSGYSISQGTVKWKANSDLKPGEFIIHSDLGFYDGRHMNRIKKVQTVLSPPR